MPNTQEETASTTSAATVPAVPPPKFLEHPGPPPLNYDVWHKFFDRFIYTLQFGRRNQLPDELKNSYLFQSLGSEGARLFALNPKYGEMSTASHEAFEGAVRDQFKVAVNQVRAHYDFQHRHQGPNESIVDYVTELRSLMADCNFHTNDNYHLGLQLVCGCRDKQAQRKLLTHKKLELAEILSVLQSEESADETAIAIGGTGQSRVYAIQKQQPRSVERAARLPDTVVCFNCGKPGHMKKDENCPARGITCNYCNVVGHYERCCRKKKAQQQPRAPSGQPLQTRVVRSSERCAAGPSFLRTVRVDVASHTTNVKVEAEADTGSDATIVSERIFKKQFPRVPLQKPNCELRNFDGTEVKGVLGTFDATVTYGIRSCRSTILVVTGTCPSVIGRGLIDRLRLLMHPGGAQDETTPGDRETGAAMKTAEDAETCDYGTVADAATTTKEGLLVNAPFHGPPTAPADNPAHVISRQ